MLSDKEQIKCDRNHTESKFQRIAGNTAEVVLQACIDDQLDHAEDTSQDVEQNLIDGPAVGGLALEVDKSLRDIFDECHSELDVAETVEQIDPCPIYRILVVEAISIPNGQEGDGQSQEAAIAQTDDGFTSALSPGDFEPPQTGKEL